MDILKFKSEDVLTKFDNITINENVKESKVKLYKGYKEQLLTLTTRIFYTLNEISYLFNKVDICDLYTLPLSRAFMSNPDYAIDCAANVKLAYVGDAYLSLYVSEVAFERNYVQEDHQHLRSSVTSNSHLSKFHDSWFKYETVLLPVNSKQSEKQKADFIEALIGILHCAGYWVLRDFICKSIVNTPQKK